MNKHIRFISALSGAFLLTQGINATVPEGYYDSLEGLSGVALKQAVKELAADHVVVEYGEADPDNYFKPVDVATWTVFPESDVREINGYSCWWDMYSSFNMRIADGHNALNIEHSVPNSWWGKIKNAAYKDLHHLNPSNAEANGKKSNNPLGETGTVSWTNGVVKIGTPKEGLGGSSKSVFEPDDLYKGDFARAYFYIFATYDDIPWSDSYGFMYDLSSNLTLQPWAYEMLLSWSASDPVSYKELNRNDVIYKYQQNRNPFIDCPELAEHIWGSKMNQPFHYSLYTPEAEDPNYPGWDEEPVEMVNGQWQPVTLSDELDENTVYLLVSPEYNRIMSNTTVSANNAMSESLYSPFKTLTTYPDIITAVPADAAFIQLKKSGSNWLMGVYDADDSFKGYIRAKSKSANQVDLSQNASQEGCAMTITVKANETVITFPYNDYNFQYNPQATRFSAYKNTQKSVQLYRPTDEILTDPEDPDTSGVGATGLEENASEEIVAIYDINGRKINTTSTLDLEKGIYIVISNFGSKKIRK